MKFIIITNNKLVFEKYSKKENVKNLNELIMVDNMEYIHVLEKARDYIHNGHVLLTHPLSGSIKPYETPYKSVVISAKPEVSNSVPVIDSFSLGIIEDSLDTTRKFIKDYKKRNYTAKHHEEFMIIDMDLVDSGIESINTGH